MSRSLPISYQFELAFHPGNLINSLSELSPGIVKRNGDGYEFGGDLENLLGRKDEDQPPVPDKFIQAHIQDKFGFPELYDREQFSLRKRGAFTIATHAIKSEPKSKQDTAGHNYVSKPSEGYSDPKSVAIIQPPIMRKTISSPVTRNDPSMSEFRRLAAPYTVPPRPRISGATMTVGAKLSPKPVPGFRTLSGQQPAPRTLVRNSPYGRKPLAPPPVFIGTNHTPSRSTQVARRVPAPLNAQRKPPVLAGPVRRGTLPTAGLVGSAASTHKAPFLPPVEQFAGENAPDQTASGDEDDGVQIVFCEDIDEMLQQNNSPEEQRANGGKESAEPNDSAQQFYIVAEGPNGEKYEVNTAVSATAASSATTISQEGRQTKEMAIADSLEELGPLLTDGSQEPMETEQAPPRQETPTFQTWPNNQHTAWQLVFPWLSRAELGKSTMLVCKDWHQWIMDTSSLWNTIKLEGKSKLDEVQLRSIGQRRPKNVNLSWTGVSRRELEECLKWMDKNGRSRLESLAISGCHWSSVQGLRMAPRGITQLDLRYVQGCTDVNFKNLVDATPQLRNLEELLLSSCDISDATVRFIANQFPKLRKLDLSYCEKMSNLSVEVLGAAGSQARSKLQMLNLSGCAQINCDVFVHLGKLTALQQIDLRAILCLDAKECIEFEKACAALGRKLEVLF